MKKPGVRLRKGKATTRGARLSQLALGSVLCLWDLRRLQDS